VLLLVSNSRISKILHIKVTQVLVGIASFFLMPQSPARTISWWNPKGYFNENEQKIIVNAGKPLQGDKSWDKSGTDGSTISDPR
jgi:hypothetical protein